MGGTNTYGYAGGNPVNSIDSLGLETCLLTTVAFFGIRDHAAICTSHGGPSGGPAIYDPAGDFASANGGGSGEIILGDMATIANYQKHHSPQKMESTCVDTSKEEEGKIIMKAEELPFAMPFQCANKASTVLNGINSFPYVEAGTFWPGNLMRQINKGKAP